MRAKWTQNLDFKIKDARKEDVEYLWFVGDYASYDPRMEPVTKAVATLFHKAELNFGILYEAEKNSGNDARRLGEEGLFDLLREKNIQAFEKAKFKYIVTTDPHSFNTLKNEYKLNGTKILHYTELISDLITIGKIKPKQKLNITATYHDPCYLGRYNNIYEPPRKILNSIGINLIEMPRNRNNSYCCGAGGGKIWMEETPNIKERPAENRVKEAAQLGVSLLVVACPKDLAMFRDAVKTTGLDQKLEVRDLGELVLETIN
jgi:Fe-S oxidoreductase